MTALLSVRDLEVRFETHAGTVRAVNGMSFDVERGEIFGLVGESGCGKSVTGMAILDMVRHPGRVTSGSIVFDGEELVGRSRAEMEQVRGRRIAMIFQDPTASLNPVFSIGSQIVRLVTVHRGLDKAEAEARSATMLSAVGLDDPGRVLKSYPHELSGGMQQRVMIAMALACGAEMLIADEPTTALDVTIQAQILALLEELRERDGLAVVFITHDLGVVAEVCDRVAVAYAGRVVETGATVQVLSEPAHPYTRGLLAALPEVAAPGRPLRVIEGSVPDGLAPAPGCAFAPRCPEAMEVCRTDPPEWADIGFDHAGACHLYPTGSSR